MSPKVPLLEQMRSNPKGDWGINDVQTLCTHHDVELVTPTKGSHYKATSPLLHGHLTIPARRPIKPVYIRLLVSMIDAHIEQQKDKGGVK